MATKLTSTGSVASPESGWQAIEGKMRVSLGNGRDFVSFTNASLYNNGEYAYLAPASRRKTDIIDIESIAPLRRGGEDVFVAVASARNPAERFLLDVVS
jgi:hypothetical protein